MFEPYSTNHQLLVVTTLHFNKAKNFENNNTQLE
jgi:hypothetical protein